MYINILKINKLKMITFILVTLFVISCILLYILLKDKKETTITYKHETFSFSIDNIKDAPDWMKYFDYIKIRKTTKTIHNSSYNREEYEYNINFQHDYQGGFGGM